MRAGGRTDMVKLIVGFRNFRMLLKMQQRTVVHIHSDICGKETGGNMTEQRNFQQHQRKNFEFRKHPVTMKSQVFSDVTQCQFQIVTDLSKVRSVLLYESL
jgi:hypothetical protein